MKPQLSCKSTQPINSHIILWKQFRTNMLVRTSKQIIQRMRKLRTFLHCVGHSRRMTFSVVVGSLGICCWIALYLSQTSWTMNPARHQQLPSFEGNPETTQVCSLGCDWWEVIVADNGLASKKVTSQYLWEWWFSSVTHIYSTRGTRVNGVTVIMHLVTDIFRIINALPHNTWCGMISCFIYHFANHMNRC